MISILYRYLNKMNMIEFRIFILMKYHLAYSIWGSRVFCIDIYINYFENVTTKPI